MRSESWEEGRAEKRFERTGYVVGRPAEAETDPTSPRREYSRSMSDNWRSSKQIEVEKRASASSSTTSSLGGGDTVVEEDNGGDWRRATSKSHDKWASRNWRDRTRNNSDDRFNPVQEEQRSYRRQRSSSSYDDDLEPDGVPEWSTMDADDMDVLGTFDSSGAFMSMRDAMALKEEEDREERWRRDSRGSSGSNDERRHSNNSTNGAMNKSDTEGIPDDRPSSDKPSAKDNELSEAMEKVDPVQAEQKMEKPQKKSKQKVETLNNNDHSVSCSVRNQDSIRAQKTPEPEPQREQPQPVQNGSTKSPAPPVEPEQIRPEENDHVSGPPPQLTQMHQRAPGQRRPEDEISFDHLETAAEEMVANWTAEEDAKSDGKLKVESGALPWEHDDAKRWFYRDPQGELQGPFNCNEMADWFSAGYFTMNLLVKRGCDDRFQPLGEIIKRWGRVPFLPGSSPPPLVHTPVSQPGPVVVAQVTKDQPQPQPAQNPPMDPQVMLMFQQQLFQQQFYLRQLQLLQQVQQNERCSKLPPEQQQALVLQLLMKHQQQQQLAAQAQQHQQHVQLPPGQLPQQQPQKISPRSTPDQQVNTPNFQNNPADLAAMMNQNLQGQAQGANQPAAGAWMQQSSVWDLPGDSAAKQQAMEEFARMENQKEQKGNEQREAEMRAQKQKEEVDEHKQRHEQEMMARQQEELKRQEEQVRRQQEEQARRQQEEMQRREEEMRRQQEMDRQRQMELQQQQEEETRRRREDEDRRRQEEEMRQRQQEMEQRQREIEQQQQMERQREMERQMKEAQRQEEMERRSQEEMQRRKAEIELDVQRQQEIQRRQEMQRQQEIHHQQQEALRRLQQQQLAQIQLPSTAQWGSQTSSGSQQPTNTMSLAQIQQLQEEKERNEREEQQRQIEIQRQQIQAFQQQQQQQQPKKWGNSPRMVNAAAPPTQHKTLMEIQEEQARQLEKEKMKQQQQQQQNKAAVPLATAAVWGGTTNSSHWAQEGAWGQAAKQQGLSFWDEAVKTSKNKVQANNQPFPALNKPTNTANNQINKKTAKTQREEENIQRLFQERLPTGNDDFSQWCESALHGMGASVDIPTFVTFLCEVDSPYEVHDYVRSYLGESREASNFAKMFIEKRSKSRNHHRPVEEDSMWGPAPAVNPNLSKVGGQVPGDFQMVGAANKKAKKKMQKLDNSILGFTVHANPDRINAGEIEMCD
ncbi:GRB10-interacting GYF protein 2-like isoform X2 [Lineus longissimus]|uniref:GRB10-interacting GYF protein 2-like isoform X2 n=1 Tax=Lineus longissimus TaxID=88925 RepID=UPI002B4EC0FD